MDVDSHPAAQKIATSKISPVKMMKEEENTDVSNADELRSTRVEESVVTKTKNSQKNTGYYV